jgi:hypothetical protein
MTKAEIENWFCSVCKEQLTFADSETEHFEQVEHEQHFDISRSKKDLTFDIDSGEIEEDVENRNEKMLIQLCESCFTKVLNESETLGKLFFVPRENCFIY